MKNRKNAYVVEKSKYWHQVGVAFVNEKSITLRIYPGLSVSGDVVLMDPKPNDKEAAK